MTLADKPNKRGFCPYEAGRWCQENYCGGCAIYVNAIEQQFTDELKLAAKLNIIRRAYRKGAYGQNDG